MFCDFYLVKNSRIGTNSTTTKALQNKKKKKQLSLLGLALVAGT
jgi:hypothetical protein